MLRRNARLRREYLYRKSLEGKEKATYEKKRKIKDAIAGLSQQRCPSHGPSPSPLSHLSLPPPLCCRLPLTAGKPIPTELKGESTELKHDIDLDDANTASGPPRTPASANCASVH